MPEDLNETLSEVTHAIENLNTLFEKKLETLHEEGVDAEDLGELQKGLLAMKDAGRIYLTWIDHFIAKLNEAEGLEELME